MRMASGLVVASIFLLVSCTRTVTLRPTQLPHLQGLAASPEVRLRDEDGDAVTISRRTRLTLYVPGFPPIESRPEDMGFSPTALRLGTAFQPQAPQIAYAQIARVDAKVRNLTGTLLAIFIPIGVFFTLFLICTVDDSCGGPGT